MKILAIEKENTDVAAEQFKPHLKREAMRVWELYKTGIIREIYFTANDNRAVLFLECNDEIEAAAFLKTLPLVKENLIQFDIFPLKNYDGFERLFEKDGVKL
jgi:hypothetical protein